MVTSRSACANESLPELPLLVSVPTPLQETVEYSHAGLAQSPMRLLLFSLGPGVYGILCAPPCHQPRSFSCPQFCGIPLIKPHWPSKPDPLGASLPVARPSGWEA